MFLLKCRFLQYRQGKAGQCRRCGDLYVFLLKCRFLQYRQGKDRPVSAVRRSVCVPIEVCARTSSAGIQGKLDEGKDVKQFV